MTNELMSINACSVDCAARANAKMLLVCVVAPWCKFANINVIYFSGGLNMDWLLGGPQLQNTGSQLGVQVGNSYRVQDTCLGEF